MEDIAKDEIEDSELVAELKTESLLIESFSSLSISLSIIKRAHDIEAIENITKNATKASSLQECLYLQIKVILEM